VCSATSRGGQRHESHESEQQQVEHEHQLIDSVDHAEQRVVVAQMMPICRKLAASAPISGSA
jgi:hypothetical protein